MNNNPKIENFRFWCQKVIPLVYDDSLSYYELLCKVVDYLNRTINATNTLIDEFDKYVADSDNKIKDVLDRYMAAKNEEINAKFKSQDTLINNFVTTMTKSFDAVKNDNATFKENISTWKTQVESWKTAVTNEFNTLKQYVENYFTNLDVQTEINNKLDTLVANGTLNDLLAPLVKANMANYESELANVKARLDNLTSAVKPGTTTGDASLIDMQMNYKKQIFKSPGEAIRTTDEMLAYGTTDVINRAVLVGRGIRPTMLDGGKTVGFTPDPSVDTYKVVVQRQKKYYSTGYKRWMHNYESSPGDLRYIMNFDPKTQYMIKYHYPETTGDELIPRSGTTEIYFEIDNHMPNFIVAEVGTPMNYLNEKSAGKNIGKYVDGTPFENEKMIGYLNKKVSKKLEPAANMFNKHSALYGVGFTNDYNADYEINSNFVVSPILPLYPLGDTIEEIKLPDVYVSISQDDWNVSTPPYKPVLRFFNKDFKPIGASKTFDKKGRLYRIPMRKGGSLDYTPYYFQVQTTKDNIDLMYVNTSFETDPEFIYTYTTQGSYKYKSPNYISIHKPFPLEEISASMRYIKGFTDGRRNNANMELYLTIDIDKNCNFGFSASHYYSENVKIEVIDRNLTISVDGIAESHGLISKLVLGVGKSIHSVSSYYYSEVTHQWVDLSLELNISPPSDYWLLDIGGNPAVESVIGYCETSGIVFQDENILYSPFITIPLTDIAKVPFTHSLLYKVLPKDTEVYIFLTNSKKIPVSWDSTLAVYFNRKILAVNGRNGLIPVDDEFLELAKISPTPFSNIIYYLLTGHFALDEPITDNPTE